jgi:hypothetical protein
VASFIRKDQMLLLNFDALHLLETTSRTPSWALPIEATPVATDSQKPVSWPCPEGLAIPPSDAAGGDVGDVALLAGAQ